MAILKQRLSQKMLTGEYATAHFETSSDIVMRDDGTTVESALKNLNNSVTNIDAQVTNIANIAGKHTHTKSDITDFPTSLPASDVYDWAKAPSKPSYTASEVGAATVNHGTHVSYSTTAPKAPGIASAGTAGTVSRSDHVHPVQTSVSGNAGTANKLTTARTIRVNLASTSAPGFDGSGNITPGVTGVLPVANGGTGVTSLSDLGRALVDTGVVSGGGGLEVALSIGTRVNWAGYTWIVVHVEDAKTYLALNRIYELCEFSSSGSTAYTGSNLAARALAFQNSLPTSALSKATNTTVEGVTAKIFVASYEQMNGAFDYFKDNESRKCRYDDVIQPYWISSPSRSGNGSVYYVWTDGSIDNSYGVGNPTYANGFRPFVALKI